MAVAQGLLDRRHEVLVRRDAALVATVMAEGCDCYADDVSTVEFFAEERLRYESQPSQVLEVSVRGRNEPTGVTFLLVNIQPFGVALYNADGSLREEIPAPDPGLVNLAVARSGHQGEWRIHDWTEAEG